MIAFESRAPRTDRLWFALAITGVIFASEIVGSILAGSLALLADAGHLLNDVLGIALALGATYIGRRAATARKTFGYYRAEVLAATANAVVLFGVSVYVLYEAASRLISPPIVAGPVLLLVGTFALVGNLASLRLLRQGAGVSLAISGAFLEVAADALSSAGTVLAGLVVLLTGWRYADPLVAAAIGLFIAPRAWHLLRSSLDVLLEGTPREIDLDSVRAALLAAPHVVDVHDLHVWTIATGFIALSAHVQVERGEYADHALHECTDVLRERFGIAHATLQVEPPHELAREETV